MLYVIEKHVVVLGLGVSGVAAARLCLANGARVTAFDGTPRERLPAAARELEARGVRILGGDNPLAAIGNADLVVISPGFPPFPELDTMGVPVISEVELAFQALEEPVPAVVAIGGTNGKSTTTALVGAIFDAHGARPFVGGNFGDPLSDHLDQRWGIVVLEVSSFQMERLETFRPRVAVLLNVTPDHLDRYPSFEDYARAKGNMFERQQPDDVAVVPYRDEICWHQARRGDAQVVTFGPGADIDVTPKAVIDRLGGHVYARSEIALTGGHNAMNVAAAVATVRRFGIPAPVIRETLRTFRGLPHRTAFVTQIKGVRFYDDSKGTNVGAAVTALRGLPESKAVLIAGGRDKGGSYEPLVQALSSKGHGAVLIGEAADLLEQAIGRAVPIRRAMSMEGAVRAAFELAQPGDAVLLSPACSSFDMFRDYKHRGDEFVRAVLAMEKEESSR